LVVLSLTIKVPFMPQVPGHQLWWTFEELVCDEQHGSVEAWAQSMK
jgi:hypothetical protein